ncbi:uncharacterized protein BDW70DRAFT_166244 [Aspergillus foveolatus]|uniref:uncharacterized protein n=1 Tax=Aspergillus foveolatus TaxID=210207 RepID=UPI003CCDA74D
MQETILITGATSSLATRIVHLVLTKYSSSPQGPSLDEKGHEYTLLLTSQNPSKIKLKLPKLTSNTNISIRTRKLDLSNLSSVHEFTTAISTDVQSGKIPRLSSIICNASYWNLRGDGELTDDGHERTFQVNYIAHTALVLRLLGSFNPGSGGNIVLLTCDAHRHWPLRSVLGRASGLEKYPPGIPADLNELVEVESQSHSQSEPQSPEQILEELQEKPKIRKNEKVEYMPRGIQRYANSKIALTMWIYALNRRLEADLALNTITAIAVNPGTLLNSRALRANTPFRLKVLSLFLMTTVRPSLSLLCRLPFVGRKFKAKKTMRSCAEAASGVVDFALGIKPDSKNAGSGDMNTGADEDGDVEGDSDGDGGYYTLSLPTRDVGLPDTHCLDEERQEALWRKTLQWTGISNGNTAIQVEI